MSLQKTLSLNRQMSWKKVYKSHFHWGRHVYGLLRGTEWMERGRGGLLVPGFSLGRTKDPERRFRPPLCRNVGVLCSRRVASPIPDRPAGSVLFSNGTLADPGSAWVRDFGVGSHVCGRATKDDWSRAAKSGRAWRPLWESVTSLNSLRRVSLHPDLTEPNLPNMETAEDNQTGHIQAADCWINYWNSAFLV